jgi:proteasome lid subunit RPN8/RPN11
VDARRSRVEVSPELPSVAIEGRVLNELCAHARETWPEECCGLVTGTGPGRYERVHRCRNDMTRLHESDPGLHPRDGTRAFFMNEHDYLRVRDEAEPRGERVTAVYHSHVGAGAYFSPLDQEFADQELFPFPDADHVVIAVVEQKIQALALFRRIGRVGFVGHDVVVGTP